MAQVQPPNLTPNSTPNSTPDSTPARQPQADPGEIAQSGAAAPATTRWVYDPMDPSPIPGGPGEYGESGVKATEIFVGIEKFENLGVYTTILYRLWLFFKDATPDGFSAIDYWATPFPSTFVSAMEMYGMIERRGARFYFNPNPIRTGLRLLRGKARDYPGVSFDKGGLKDLPYRREEWV